MSQQTNSINTSRSTCSRESEASRSPSSGQTLGEIAALLQRDFRAKISQSPAKDPDLKASEADSFGRPLRPLAWFDQTSSSWRMCQPSLLEESEPFSGRWPRSGIVLNGIAYLLPTLARRTDVIASGLSESGMWPTPRSAYSQGSTGGKDRSSYLRYAVKMWPTPSTRDYKGGYQGGRIRNGKISRDTLDVTVQHTDNQAKMGGQLSVDWVSILMGYDLDWTSVEDGNAVSHGSPRGRKTEPKD